MNLNGPINMRLKQTDTMSSIMLILIKFGNNLTMLKIDGSINRTISEEKWSYSIEWKKIKLVMEFI